MVPCCGPGFANGSASVDSDWQNLHTNGAVGLTLDVLLPGVVPLPTCAPSLASPDVAADIAPTELDNDSFGAVGQRGSKKQQSNKSPS